MCVVSVVSQSRTCHLPVSLGECVSVSISRQVARVNDPIKPEITRPKLQLRRWLKTTQMMVAKHTTWPKQSRQAEPPASRACQTKKKNKIKNNPELTE